MRLLKWMINKTVEGIVFYTAVLIAIGIIFKEKRAAKRALGL